MLRLCPVDAARARPGRITGADVLFLRPADSDRLKKACRSDKPGIPGDPGKNIRPSEPTTRDRLSRGEMYDGRASASNPPSA